MLKRDRVYFNTQPLKCRNRQTLATYNACVLFVVQPHGNSNLFCQFITLKSKSHILSALSVTENKRMFFHFQAAKVSCNFIKLVYLVLCSNCVSRVNAKNSMRIYNESIFGGYLISPEKR